MELKTVRHLWGLPGTLDNQLRGLREKGYTFIESGLPRAGDENAFMACLEKEGMGYIAQIHSQGNSPDEHRLSFRDLCKRAAALNPLFINSHSGSDGFTRTESEDFFGFALEYEKDIGIAVCHETHRGRILYNPWAASSLAEKFPELKLTADYSHWACVTESLLGGLGPLLTSLARHVHHIHARVGHEHGPQVSDPRAPEFANHVKAHEFWWDEIWKSQKERGYVLTTLTPEFGPPGYMPTLPYTGARLANLEEICDWQAHRQMERFHSRINA